MGMTTIDNTLAAAARQIDDERSPQTQVLVILHGMITRRMLGGA